MLILILRNFLGKHFKEQSLLSGLYDLFLVLLANVSQNCFCPTFVLAGTGKIDLNQPV